MLYIDNQAAISQVESEASSSKSKHVHIKHKFLKKEYYRKGAIKPVNVPTADMKADILTKATSTPTFRLLREMIGLKTDMRVTQSGGVLEG